MAASSITSAAQWIATQMANEANFLFPVQDQVRNLHYELKYIQQLVRDVDSPEGVGNSQLQILMEERIRNIVFRAEDVIDTYIVEVASLNNEDGNSSRDASFLVDVLFRQLVKDIEAIVTGLREASKQLQVPGAIAREGPSNDNNRPKRAGNYKVLTYAHTDDGYFVGREDDIEKLVRLVTGKNYSGEGCSQEVRVVAMVGVAGVGKTTMARNIFNYIFNYIEKLVRLVTGRYYSGEGCSQEARVVAIVGAGGVGKTTLARKIYKDERVKDHFRRAAWVTISQQWNTRDLLLQILSQTGAIKDDQERNSLQGLSEPELVVKTHGFLNENLHLIVLDDMWTKEAWADICAGLPLNYGSKVIFTTRNNDLPSYVDLNCVVHQPTLLTGKQSVELFKKIAFRDEDIRATRDDFVRLGTEMTRKCYGLPLAVVILAGLLRTKRTLGEWKDVSKKFGSLLLKVKGPAHYGKSVYQTLMLSYHDLPDNLKPCFLYLAQLPEHYPIESEKLIQMWIAEGFVPGDENQSEEVAREYLNELICRCMVLVVESDLITTEAKSILLHDVMREFCIAKAKDECFLEVHGPNDQRVGTSRRVSILPGGTSIPTQNSHIRSFIQFGVQYISPRVSLPASWTEHFKLLRVLIFDQVETHDGYLPEILGSFKHLRYLALIDTNIKTLPESIGNLSNLLYLEYKLGWEIKGETLPNVFWKMKQLRHLYLDTHVWLAGFPKGLKLHPLTTNLQTLWMIEGTCSEEEMERMGPRLTKLGIRHIKSQRLLDALFRSPCMTSGNLLKLSLGWTLGAELKSMEPLYNHCQRLRWLSFWGKIGENCPLHFPPSLVELRLDSSMTCNDPMAAAGRLGQLRTLLLSSTYVGAKITCDVASFPQLKRLSLISLDNLEEWRVEEGAMPRLDQLEISDCRKFKRLPEELKSICSLQNLGLSFMPRSFCHRLFRQGDKTAYQYRAGFANEGEKGEDFHIIQHISHVGFQHVLAKEGDDEAKC
ncbi:hypothetical protein Ancab_039629 [Ancistrocladus abbreviatus]